MDEEIEKPFPIEYFAIFFIIAAANDIARVFFLFLDFTGVGIDGEAIMEPINLVLDFFFIGVFRWRTKSFGGSTMTQYGGSIFEFFGPVRMFSVGAGMYLANNPNSIFGKIATTAASLETGNVAGEIEGAAKAEKKLQSEGVSAGGAGGESESESKTAEEKGLTTESRESGSPEGEGGGENENAPENDIFKNPYDNPVGTAGKELNEPPEEEFHEGEGFNRTEAEEEPQEQQRAREAAEARKRIEADQN